MRSKGPQITLPKTESTAQWGWWKLLTQEKAAIFCEIPGFACEARAVSFSFLLILTTWKTEPSWNLKSEIIGRNLQKVS
jgi:hypothetical protein